MSGRIIRTDLALDDLDGADLQYIRQDNPRALRCSS